MTFYVSRLALDDFRSWKSLIMDFKPGVTVLVGKNGVGKTNIVEAIEFLSQGESHRTAQARNLVRRGQARATVRANVTHATNGLGRLTARPAVESSESGGPLGVETKGEVTAQPEPSTEGADTFSTRTIELTIPQRGPVRSRVNSGSAGYLRDVAGQLKVIVFNPRDQQLVTGDPAGRRAFLDSAATMMFPDYYAALQNFRHIAKQRAAVLKRLSETGGRETDFLGVQAASLSELEVWTTHFIDVGLEITRRRAAVVAALKADFTETYSRLAGGKGLVELTYEPSFEEFLDVSVLPSSTLSVNQATIVKQAIARHFQNLYVGEVARAANLIGPHRDDLTVSMDGVPARDYASNGELWTLGLALKLAQFDYFARQDSPILILDDVFAQLDESRRQQILDFASRQEQVIITVAARSDIPALGEAMVIDVEELARSAGQAGSDSGGQDRLSAGQRAVNDD